MSKLITKKFLLCCLAVSLVLIVAGALVLGLAGFNPDTTMRDRYIVEVKDLISLDESSRKELSDFCNTEIEKQYSVSQIRYSESSATGGGVIEFVLASNAEEPSEEFLEGLKTSIGGSGIEGIDGTLISVTYHDSDNIAYYGYIWRTAIGVGAVLVLLFVYISVRFKVGMGLTALLAGLHDVLLTLAIVALLRIPAGIGLAGVAVFSLMMSALLNLFVFGKMRRVFRAEETKTLPAREAVAYSVSESRKGALTIAVLAAAVCVVLGVVGVIIGFDLTSFMLSALMAVIASTYSSLLFAPAIYAGIKEKSDAAQAKKSKYNYVSDKKKEKEAKASQKQQAAGEVR